MEKVKNYIQLHLNILLFSLTSVFSKMASVQYNRHGLGSIWLYVCRALWSGDGGVVAIYVTDAGRHIFYCHLPGTLKTECQ